MAQPITPIKSSTQVFAEVEDITQDMVMLRDGSCALVIKTSAVNFDLLSEQEQEVRILSYANFLNSLSFPVQIVIRSEKKDVSAYLHLLEEHERTQKDPVLATRIKSYREFITSTVKDRNVLDKKFYIVVPYSVLELGATHVNTLIKKSGLPYQKSYILERAKTALTPRRDHVLRQLGRLGLIGIHLTTKELIELFYNIYHPGMPHEVAKAVDQTAIL